MNILLTGGSGFIGKNICESYLSDKYNILAPTHDELDLIDDIQTRKFFLENKIDVVIHSACKPCHRNAKDPSNILYTNGRMFFNLLRNSSYYQKMIILGSGAAYDTRYSIPKVTEKYLDTYIPVDELGFQKYITAKQIELMDNVIELRIFGIFGKYEDYAIRFISNAICKTLYDLPITIKQNRKFDYIYIDDLMPILDHFIFNTGKYKAYNVTPDNTMELCEIAEKVIKVSGKDLPITVEQPDLGLEYSGNNDRLYEEIPGLNFISIDEAIVKLYNWYSKDFHLINKEFLLIDK
ncbi:MAG: epimerase [Candidatus Melainabacteria bacterium RIFOXYA12_FULL_32_12]|nr:MAG: epimerase [Candidatus Melainabacteria bacterium RIFOXYA2_FULL_32_9]OGI30849.1 MAG: epimerase [Candidatus Melainabacteria bacterium RIFOXYA12_FULL_32_12]